MLYRYYYYHAFALRICKRQEAEDGEGDEWENSKSQCLDAVRRAVTQACNQEKRQPPKDRKRRL